MPEEGDLNGLQIQLNGLQAQLNGLQAQLNSVQDELAKTLGSYSWKVTAPLRVLATLLLKTYGQALVLKQWFTSPREEPSINRRPLLSMLKSFLRSDSPLRYEYAVDMTFDSAPANVIRMVGTRRKVLEIGAGPGSITRILTLQNQCQVTAIEIDDVAIEKLREFCQRVIKLDLNAPDWPEALSEAGPFEVIVIADVLEHLLDPWKALAAARNLLTPDGYLVVSLPHAAHTSVIACLLNENFEYRDEGLLDRTHIRFFGIHNIQQLFQGAKLKITDARFVMRAPEQTEFAAQWAMIPQELRTMLTRNPYGNVYQVVVKAIAANGTGHGFDLIRPLTTGRPAS